MNATPSYQTAPELQVSAWFNTDERITLAALRGKVVVIEAFQMLCPGCVIHGLPQATTIAETFPHEHVAVLGLHSVFEHHEAMAPHALKAFLYEYRIQFPVGVDMPSEKGESPIPKTMQAYELRGTPSLLLIDRQGRLRLNQFGRISDMQVAAEISSLIHESGALTGIADTVSRPRDGAVCTPEGCNA